MTKKASDVNEILLSVTTTLQISNHCRSLIMSIGQIFFKKLGFLNKIFSKKKTIIFISNKVYEDLKANKAR